MLRWLVDASTCPQCVLAVHHDANLFRDQMLCQDDSAKDILEHFNELTVVNNGDGGSQKSRCACLWGVQVSFRIICEYICVCFDFQHLRTQQEASE